MHAMHWPQVGRGFAPTPSNRPALPSTAAKGRPSKQRMHIKAAAQAGSNDAGPGSNDAGSGETTSWVISACRLVQGSTLCVLLISKAAWIKSCTAEHSKQCRCQSLCWHPTTCEIEVMQQDCLAVQVGTQVRRASGRTQHSQPICRSVCTAKQLQDYAWRPGCYGYWKARHRPWPRIHNLLAP